MHQRRRAAIQTHPQGMAKPRPSASHPARLRPGKHQNGPGRHCTSPSPQFLSCWSVRAHQAPGFPAEAASGHLVLRLGPVEGARGFCGHSLRPQRGQGLPSSWLPTLASPRSRGAFWRSSAVLAGPPHGSVLGYPRATRGPPRYGCSQLPDGPLQGARGGAESSQPLAPFSTGLKMKN